MHRFPGKGISWLVTGSARFDPNAGRHATSILPPRAPTVVPRTLADKVEDLVQAAYDAGDSGTGRHLAVVRRNMQRRAGQGGPLSLARAATYGARAEPPAGRSAPRAANDL